MALPLAPGVQVGETHDCRLHKAADTSGNLLGIWFLGSEDVLLAAAGGSGEGGRAGSPCQGGGIPGCGVHLPGPCWGAGCAWWRWEQLPGVLVADAGSASGWRRAARNFLLCSKWLPLQV